MIAKGWFSILFFLAYVSKKINASVGGNSIWIARYRVRCKFYMGITQAEYDFLMGEDKSFKDLITPIQLGPAPLQWVKQINSTKSKEIFL